MADSAFLFPSSNVVNLKNSAALIHSRMKSRLVACYCIERRGNKGRLNSRSSSAINAPTAPWMNKPLLVNPGEILDLKKQRSVETSVDGTNGETDDVDLMKRVGGGRNKLAMKKIFRGIEKLRQPMDSEESVDIPEKFEVRFAPGDLFEDEDHHLNGEEFDTNDKGSEESSEVNGFEIPFREVVRDVRFKKLPWIREETVDFGRIRNAGTLKEYQCEELDGVLLERLKSEAAKMNQWIKVKKAGVTQAVVDDVHSAWKSNELALLKFDVPLCRNMSRAREIVELKTGGVTIWRHKDFLAVYRGNNHSADQLSSTDNDFAGSQETSSSNMGNCDIADLSSKGAFIGLEDDEQKCLGTASLYEREADRLLDGLGPRFIDWWMHKPLPVDADLLPESVPGLKVPSRLCPPFTKSKLIGAELTYLRKLAHSLPTHFVLGRNRRLQGLAAAILKLWEKCHIAKIALKWGIPNTDNEQMANELKSLTGGVLLLRNKFLIVLYRGKDFLPSTVAEAVAQRENELSRSQLQEEAARLKASETFSITGECSFASLDVGTLSEFHSIHSEGANSNAEVDVQLESERERLEKELKEQQRRLSVLKKKIEKTARDLEKLKDTSRLSEPDPDTESISNEESQNLRKMGLVQGNTLVLGRRGVFDGVIEGMHQHWKHKETVKVITMQKNYSQMKLTAKTLEVESGGTIVSIDRIKEGYAIIFYRGKNYRRPKCPSLNLMTKREALFYSLQLQRLGSLKFFAKQRELAIADLQLKLGKLSGPTDSVLGSITSQVCAGSGSSKNTQ